MDTAHIAAKQVTQSADLDTQLLSPMGVAERLAISRSQVYNLIDAGRLRTVKIGRSVRVPLRSVYDLIEALSSDQADPS